MQCRDSAPTLIRVRDPRNDRQFRNRELRNGFKRLVERVAFACRETNLPTLCKKRRQVIVARLCGTQKRLRTATPCLDLWHRLAGGQFAPAPLLNGSQDAQTLATCLS